MDKDRINEEAREFQKEGCCFIHVENIEGQHESVIAGDGVAIMESLAAIIEALANSQPNMSFESVLKILIMEHIKSQIKQEAGMTDRKVTSFTFPKMKKPDEES